MERKYKLLDCCCKAGGASMGYYNAGFEVVGVDIEPQPNYPFEFIRGDVLKILKDDEFISQFSIITCSPPCQKYSRLKYLSGNVEKWDEEHVDLVGPVRELLQKTGKPYVIENVSGAPLIDPITLYGSQFPNMYTQRPRLFESNIPLKAPDAPVVRHKTLKLGEGPAEDGYITVAGKKPPKGMNEIQAKLYYGFALGGIDWMSLEELTQAIPPIYCNFIGKQLIEYLDRKNMENVVNINKIIQNEDFMALVRKYMEEAV